MHTFLATEQNGLIKQRKGIETKVMEVFAEERVMQAVKRHSNRPLVKGWRDIKSS